MQIKYYKIKDLKPYLKNPRINKEAVKFVAESIKEFGFKVPIIIDKNNIIVAGHTRLEASKLLKLKEVPCIIADDLTEEQINAFRLVDNKVSEFANWDMDKIKKELKEIKTINMELFDIYNFNDILSEEEQNKIAEELYEDKIEKEVECPFCHKIGKESEFKN